MPDTMSFPKERHIDEIILACIILMFAAVRLHYSSLFGLFEEEAAQWFSAKHSFFNSSNFAPLNIWIMRLFTLFDGGTIFSIRLSGMFFSVLSTIFIYLVTSHISSSKKSGLYSAIILNCIPVFFFESCLGIIPETIEVFFFLAALFFFLKAVSSSKIIYWILLGIFVGLGFHSVLYLIPIFFIFLAASHGYKKWLVKKELYISLGIAFIIAFPIILMNIHHNWWAVYARGVTYNISLKGIFSAIYNHMFAYSPLMYLIFIISALTGGYHAVKEKNDKFLFLFICWAVIFGVINLISLFNPRGVDFDLFITAFLPPMIFSAIFFSRMLQNIKGNFRVLIISIAVVACITALLFTSLSMHALLRGKPDIFLERISYDAALYHSLEKLAKKIDEIKDYEVKSSGKKMRIFSCDDNIPWPLEFYTKDKSAYYVNLDENTQLEGPGKSGAHVLGGDAIFVTSKYENVEKIRKYFKVILEEEPFVTYLNGRPLRAFYIFRCYK